MPLESENELIMVLTVIRNEVGKCHTKAAPANVHAIKLNGHTHWMRLPQKQHFGTNMKDMQVMENMFAMMLSFCRSVSGKNKQAGPSLEE